MKIKVEMEMPIEVKGDRVFIKGNDTLNRVLGTSNAVGNARQLGLTKHSNQEWSISIEDLKKRREELTQRAKDTFEKVEFINQIIEQISPSPHKILSGFETFAPMLSDKFVENYEDKINEEDVISIDDLDDYSGFVATDLPKPETRHKKSWSPQEQSIVLQGITRMGDASCREVANSIKHLIPNRTMIALELYINKIKRGVVKIYGAQSSQPVQQTIYRMVKSTGRGKGRGKNWSVMENKMIRDNLNKYDNIEDLATALERFLPNRTHKAISLQIFRIKTNKASTPKSAKTRTRGKSNGKWTKDEEDTIIRNKTLQPNKIALLLGRTTKATAQHMYFMKKDGRLPKGELPPALKTWKEKNKGNMIRNHPLPVQTSQTNLNDLTSKIVKQEKDFPGFSMISHAHQNYLITLIKNNIRSKGRIEYKDISWIQTFKGRWDFNLWNDFITEFIQNAKKIAEYFGMANKFAIEKVGQEQRIVYR